MTHVVLSYCSHLSLYSFLIFVIFLFWLIIVIIIINIQYWDSVTFSQFPSLYLFVIWFNNFSWFISIFVSFNYGSTLYNSLISPTNNIICYYYKRRIGCLFYKSENKKMHNLEQQKLSKNQWLICHIRITKNK